MMKKKRRTAMLISAPTSQGVDLLLREIAVKVTAARAALDAPVDDADAAYSPLTDEDSASTR